MKYTTNDRTVSGYFQQAAHLCIKLEQLPEDAPERSGAAEDALYAAEHAVLAARRSFGEMLEKKTRHKTELTPPNIVSGTVQLTREGWTVIRLETLLQNARRRTTGYIENSLLCLLQQWRGNGGVLPWYQRCFVVITEHTGLRHGNVYDPDNREWKSVTNALKGVLFEDDDQMTISLILDTVPDDSDYTEVVVVPYHEITEYLSRRCPGR